MRMRREVPGRADCPTGVSRSNKASVGRSGRVDEMYPVPSQGKLGVRISQREPLKFVILTPLISIVTAHPES
jgi:hypothetical protein